ncbi:UNC-like C-terminal-domain-containing protein [Sporodiniella umbellata]|nr:UNC-like C-terminal-domain-containing protein [Sporodiniella umbellata]
MSNTPQRYTRTSTPNKERPSVLFREPSSSRSTEFSGNVRFGSPSSSFSRNNNSSNNNPKTPESQSSRHMNQEGITNDVYLKSILRKPSACNSNTDENSFDEGYIEYDAYDELELMVNNPILEEKMRMVNEQAEEVNRLRDELLLKQRRQQQNKLRLANIRLLPDIPSEEETVKEDEGFKSVFSYYFSKWFELVIFQFFMVYWIIKEPIIRTVTFFTMIVSALLVTPALFIFTKLFNQGTLNSNKRKQITSACTGALFLWLLYIAYPHIQSNLPQDFWKPVPNSSHDLFAIQQRLSQWETQFNDNDINYRLQYNDLSIKTESEIKFIKDRIDASSAETLQKLTSQQSNIDAVAQQYRKLIEKLTGFENNFLSDPLYQLKVKEFIAEQIKGLVLQESVKELIKETIQHQWSEISGSRVDEIADFALESRGARVIHSMTSKTFQPLAPWVQVARRMVGLNSRIHTIPEMALQPQIYVGECWSMDGTRGDLTILLSERISVESITIEYPNPEVMKGRMSTAPNNIQVLGIKDYKEYPTVTKSMGLVQYDISKNLSAQNFKLESKDEVYEAVVIKILSNWGSSLHTDLYRVQIHGSPV